MYRIKLIVLCSLTFSLISVHAKVVYQDDNSAETGIITMKIESDNREKVSIASPATAPSITDPVDSDVQIASEISNRIDNSIVKNNTKIRGIKGKCAISKISPKGCAFKTNHTENLAALILTPYIEQGRIADARNASKVDPRRFLGLESYSGYFTVNKTYNSNIFFWYFPVANKSVESTPWIVWLQGGPGASSMISLFDEIGPFKMQSSYVLKKNEHTWLRNHSLVFFDNPVGTGFSFTEHKQGFTRDMATYSSQLYSAFEQFVRVFPELRSAPLYVGGESYAGKYVPSLGVEIHKRMDQPDHVNLQGFMIGNAYVDPAVIPQMTRPFYNFGLIEEEQLEMVKPLVESLKNEFKANNSTLAKVKWMNLLNVLLMMAHLHHGYNYLTNDPIMDRYSKFLNMPPVQKAIHVRSTKYSFVNMTVNDYLSVDFLSNAKPHFETLLDHYRVLAYCGQLDLMMPCITLSENYRTWKWNGTEQFRKAKRLPYLYKKKCAGYHKSGGGLTEVTFLGAGHMVPMDKPGPTQDLVTRWTHNQKLNEHFYLIESSFLDEIIKNNTILPYL